MSSSPLKAALVGYGYVGKTMHAPLLTSTQGFNLHTVVSNDPTKVRADYPECSPSAPMAQI